MRRAFGWSWLVVVAIAAVYLAFRVAHGLSFQTDLTALLPRDEADPARQHASDVIVGTFSKRVVLLVGSTDRAAARAATQALGTALQQQGLATASGPGLDKDRLRALGSFYFPYRAGLLADGDRDSLAAGKPEAVEGRALAQLYSPVGIANAGLLSTDPFLLLPSFFTGLPVPASKLVLDDGMLSVKDGATTWVLWSGTLTGAPYALATQKQLEAALDTGFAQARAAQPDLKLLRLGAVFFAAEGARSSISESSTIGLLSVLGTILLVVAVFRAATPLLFTIMVIGVGVLTALSASLALFGEIHVGAMLFGVSLIGVAVDYCLQYCTELFTGEPDPHTRLRRILMPITLGTTTTVIGYLTLVLAPFPGLRQIALFSAIGLCATWITVVVWLPFLDRSKPPGHGAQLLAGCRWFLELWEMPAHRRWLAGGLAVLVVAGGFGWLAVTPDDDVHHLQSLAPGLLAEQTEIQRLTGIESGSQFFLVTAPDDETALRQEETLRPRLAGLASFQMLSAFVPSAARQKEARDLVGHALGSGFLAAYRQKIGLEAPAAAPAPDATLTIDKALAADSPLAFLGAFRLVEPDGRVEHLIPLDRVTNPDKIATAAAGLQGVQFVDPAAGFSALLSRYRLRALVLLAASAILMAPILIWRYGLRRGLWVMAPPLLAVVLAPPLRALTGGSFTFFDAMALVLILSIGVDYAVFCAETGGARKPVSMLAIALAAMSALLSFGLLAASKVLAVHNFGATLLIGILIAFLLAPMARWPLSDKDGAKDQP